MQALYLKEHDEIGNNPMASVPSSLPMGTHQSFQLKPLLMEHPSNGDHLISTKQQRTIFPGDCKNSGDEHKSQAVISLQSDPSENRARFELGFGQPMGCAKYPCMDQFYGVFPTYGAQISGRIMLPFNLASEEGPIYVNAKQYNGIMRRRQSRAKVVLQNIRLLFRLESIYAPLSPSACNAPAKGIWRPVPENPKFELGKRWPWDEESRSWTDF